MKNKHDEEQVHLLTHYISRAVAYECRKTMIKPEDEEEYEDWAGNIDDISKVLIGVNFDKVSELVEIFRIKVKASIEEGKWRKNLNQRK